MSIERQQQQQQQQQQEKQQPDCLQLWTFNARDKVEATSQRIVQRSQRNAIELVQAACCISANEYNSWLDFPSPARTAVPLNDTVDSTMDRADDVQHMHTSEKSRENDQSKKGLATGQSLSTQLARSRTLSERKHSTRHQTSKAKLDVPQAEWRALQHAIQRQSDLLFARQYQQDALFWSGDRNPERQHPAKVRKHFKLAISSSSDTQLASTPQDIGFKSQLALHIGRRGSWLVPLLGTLPFESASEARWVEQVATSASPDERNGSSECVVWTESRFEAFCVAIHAVAAKGRFGEIHMRCEMPQKSNPTAQLQPGSSYWPPLVRISADAHLALPLRAVLNLVTARDRDSMDKKQFLKKCLLVWVDENGEALLGA
ncbi:hypothetical protein OIO90_004056 [Microbotryomycetes sp. JL221]|nr:hypothetical protein OIO90_004056 [Microbotryomycetes sp. JL221]